MRATLAHILVGLCLAVDIYADGGGGGMDTVSVLLLKISMTVLIRSCKVS